MSPEADRAPSSRASRPSDYLFCVLDASAPEGSPSRHDLEGVREVVIGRGARGATRQGPVVSLSVPDRWASSRHARLVRESDGWWIEDLRSKNGTCVAGVTVTRRKLFDGDVIEVGHTFFRLRTGLASSDGPPDRWLSQDAPLADGLATLLPDLEATFAVVARTARTTAPLLILGETGTGKDVTARAYHALTGRKGKWVPVNCGAIPATLVEATLFGHVRGAFSSASADSLGLVRSADRGTLFLDELGDLPLASQAALLRVIEAREVQPIGSSQPVPVDVRVVAATHRDLPRMVSEGSFRADLLARLSADVVRLPPLRQRKEDLGLLVGAALRVHAPTRAGEVGLDLEGARALLARDFPLNTRELMNDLGRALTHGTGNLLGVEHLAVDGLALLSSGSPVPGPGPEQPEASTALAHGSYSSPPRISRRAQLERLLEEHGGNVTEVARTLGKTRSVLYKWLGQLGVDPARYRE